MYETVDNVCALQRLAQRINRKDKPCLYDVHVVGDAVDEINELRRTIARLVDTANKPPKENSDV